MVKNLVKQHRQKTGLTLNELAELSGVPVSTINDIEHGAEPRVVTAILLAKALKVSVENLWQV